MGAPTPEQLRFILKCGILAPSADNHHLLRFAVDQAGIDAWYCGGKLPEAGGYKRVLVLLSLGAVAENLSVAASRYGIRAEPVLFPDATRPDLAFRAPWEPPAGGDDSLWKEIPRRHTNRNIRYHGPGLSPTERARLECVTEALPGAGLTWLDDPRARHHALGLMRLAEGERFRSWILHQELFGEIRFDVGWHRGCEEGLPPGALGVEPPLRPAFALLRHWRVMRMANFVGAHRLLGWRAADLPARFSPHLLAITVGQPHDVTVFAAGRALQRIWLEVTRLGMVLQPMPASALYALEGARREGIPDGLQERLRDGWRGLVPGRHPLMLVRIGRAAQSAVTAGRKPLEDYWSGG